MMSGNGLTVFQTKTELPPVLMQAITREMRQFESIFLVTTADPTRSESPRVHDGRRVGLRGASGSGIGGGVARGALPRRRLGRLDDRATAKNSTGYDKENGDFVQI